MTLEKRVWLAGEEAAWLADNIVATSEYGNDAARLLRMMSDVQKQNAELQQELYELAALLEVKDAALEGYCGDLCNAEYNPCLARQALSTTGPDALREVKARALEEAAKYFEPRDAQDMWTAYGVNTRLNDSAAAIRRGE